jgi:hypothetical protein
MYTNSCYKAKLQKVDMSYGDEPKPSSIYTSLIDH